MSQCAGLAVHPCTESIRCSGEDRTCDLGPGGQTPYLRRVRGSVLQVKVIWMYSVGKMSERREKARGSFYSRQVQGSCSVEEQRGFWWFGESDDQYGGV